MRFVRLTGFQLRFVNKTYWRNPTAAFFTFAFPLMLLVIFTALLGNGHVYLFHEQLRQSTYYVAQMAAFGVISACYTYVGIALTFQRDFGVLKRANGTPMPALAFFAARVLHAMFVALLLVVITAGFGRLAYHAHVPGGATLLRFLVMLVVGAMAFCALGFAITAAIPNMDAAAPVVQASMLPLLFLSGVFIPLGDDAAGWVKWVSRIFPVRHFADGMLAGFLGTPFRWSDVLVVAAWGVGGIAIAVRYFSWEPRT
ncbi:MAG TPA: ABC transporter permease [Mycobacteriales bacterium]|nr:ABC transporter permease [Mycobacteriales bacterium]